MGVIVIFWLAVGLAVYTYFGYPLLLFIVTSVQQSLRDLRFLFRRSSRRVRGEAEGDLPKVSIIVPAHNEEAAIAEKIENCLSLDYPREQLEILIASDGSDDRTNEIARGYADRGILLAAYEERRGKPSALNDTVERATGSILVFSDATTMIDPNALLHIMRHFRDPKVGAVNGELRFESPDAGHSGEGAYWRYEVMLKFMENRLGVVLGSSGALCAVRRDAYRPIPANCICDDLVITLNVLLDGRRAVYDPEAQSVEQTAADVKKESSRRERIGAGNFQALGLTWRLLNPLRGWVALCYLSHKIFKWMTWAFMVVAFLANLFLLSRSLYQVAFGLQLAFYGAALVGAMRVQIPLVSKIGRIAYYFVAMHVALFRGLIRHLRGTQRVAWQREHR